jgi:hypothetical protein
MCGQYNGSPRLSRPGLSLQSAATKFLTILECQRSALPGSELVVAVCEPLTLSLRYGSGLFFLIVISIVIEELSSISSQQEYFSFFVILFSLMKI